MNEEQINCFVNLILDRINLWLYDYGEELALSYFVQYITLFKKGYQANDYEDIFKKIILFLMQERPAFILIWLKPEIILEFTSTLDRADGEIKLPQIIQTAVFRDMMFVANGNYETTWENLDRLFQIWNVTGEDDPRVFFEKE